MKWYHFIEIAIIGYFIFLQIKTGFELKHSIRTLKYIIPKRRYFKTERFFVPKELIQKGSLAEIAHLADPSNREEYTEKGIELTLINPLSPSGTEFDRILDSLNTYLVRNNGGIADFSIVKDLVERNVSVEEDDIKESVNKPLYLGLMATILGIIFGLSTMLLKLSTSSAEVAGQPLELDDFLLAVCIAMTSSFLGLLITSFVGLNSYKEAKRIMEQNKNEFYNFVQTDLLPAVSQDFGTSIGKLTQTMNGFNLDFTANIGTLSHLFQKNYETLKVQDAVLERLENLNANDFVKMNAEVLLRLEKATNNFDQFNMFMESLNSRLTETRELTDSIGGLLNRVNNFEELAGKIDARVEDTNSIVSFLKQQFSSFEQMTSVYKNMVKRVDDNLDETLRVFENNVIQNRQGLTNLINEQHELLEKAYRENVTKFDKLDHLDHLLVLPEIKKGFEQHQEEIEREQHNNSNKVAALNTAIKGQDTQFKTINKTLEKVGNVVVKATEKKEEMDKLSSIAKALNQLKEEFEKSNVSIFKKIFRGK